MNRSDNTPSGSVLSRLLFSSAIAWGVFGAYNVLLFYFSTLPGDDIPQVFDLNDKLIHAAGYFVLTILSAHAFFHSRSVILTAKPYFWAGFWAVNVSALTEMAQHFVPGRFTDPEDLLANTAGIAAALGVLLLVRPDKRLTSNNSPETENKL